MASNKPCVGFKSLSRRSFHHRNLYVTSTAGDQATRRDIYTSRELRVIGHARPRNQEYTEHRNQCGSTLAQHKTTLVQRVVSAGKRLGSPNSTKILVVRFHSRVLCLSRHRNGDGLTKGSRGAEIARDILVS